jgi:hypothetical protein
MISCLVSNMVAKSKIGIKAARDANETLVGLDLTEGAPGKPLNTRFKVCPEDVLFPFAGDGGLLLHGKGLWQLPSVNQILAAEKSTSSVASSNTTVP